MVAHNITTSESATRLDDPKLIHTNITMRVPQSYHQEPIISRLVSDHGVVVNITSALLGENARQDGWFNLELHGSNPQIQSALIYLEELNLEIWERNGTTEDIW